MRNKFAILLILYSVLANGQLSEQDSTFLKSFQHFKQQIQNAPVYFDDYVDSLTLIHEENPSDYTQGLLSQLKATYFEKKEDYPQALLYYTRSESELERCCRNTKEYLEAILGKGFKLVNAGLLNFDTTYFQKAFNEIKRGYELSKEINDRFNELRCLDFIGDYFYYSAYRIQDMDSAYYYYQKLEDEVKNHPESDFRFISNKQNLANVHRRLGNTSTSEEYYEEAIALASKYDYNSILFGVFVDKAEVLEENGLKDEVLALQLKSYEYVKKTEDKEFINRMDRQLYQTYKSLGKEQEALKHLEDYISSVEEMNKSGALKLQIDIEKQREIDERTLEITKLQNQNLQAFRNFLMALAGLCLVVIAILIYFFRQLRSSNQMLKKKNNEILMAQLKGQTIERKRMAGELHDNLNTKIAAVKYRLEAQKMNASGKQKEIIGDTVSLVDDIYEDIRLISHNLVPETVEEIGLVASFEKLLKVLNENDSVNFHLISSLESENDIKHIAYELYNIVFEMINNILKHSGAENAWVSISKIDQKLAVTVSDDGKGFKYDDNMEGFGLRSIHSRIEKLRGKYQIESKLEKGTRLTIEIPID